MGIGFLIVMIIKCITICCTESKTSKKKQEEEEQEYLKSYHMVYSINDTKAE